MTTLRPAMVVAWRLSEGVIAAGGPESPVETGYKGLSALSWERASDGLWWHRRQEPYIAVDAYLGLQGATLRNMKNCPDTARR
jgi:hypothetical protein